MSEENPKPQLTPEQHAEVDAILAKFDEKLVKIINFDSIAPNSVIAFEIDPESSLDFIMSLPRLTQKYQSQIKEKNLSIVIMPIGAKISTLDEQEMNQIGWYKKEPSLIIRP